MKWWAYVLIFILSQLAGGVAGIVLVLLFPQGEQSMMIAAALGVANVLAIVLTLLTHPGFRAATSRAAAYGIISLLMAPPIIFLVNWIQELLPELPSFVDDWTLEGLIRNPLGIFVIAVLAPIAEELMFRAGVLGCLLKSAVAREEAVATTDSRLWRAVLWSALVFSVAHMNPVQMPAAFILGILLGWAYWKSGSLVVPCVIHILNNSLAVGLTLLADNPDVTLTQFIGSDVGVAVAVGVSAVWLGLCVWRVNTSLNKV